MARLIDMINNVSTTTEDNSEIVEMIESVIEMIEFDSLNVDEMNVLTESIEDIFNTILEESKVIFDEMECDEDEDGCNVCGDCTDKDELDSHDGICDNCYSEKEEGLDEAMLKKTSAKKRKAAKAYARSAKGKKSLKLVAKKRKKYATKIKRCAGKGKTFSFKAMSCVKPKKRR